MLMENGELYFQHDADFSTWTPSLNWSDQNNANVIPLKQQEQAVRETARPIEIDVESCKSDKSPTLKKSEKRQVDKKSPHSIEKLDAAGATYFYYQFAHSYRTQEPFRVCVMEDVVQSQSPSQASQPHDQPKTKSASKPLRFIFTWKDARDQLETRLGMRKPKTTKKMKNTDIGFLIGYRELDVASALSISLKHCKMFALRPEHVVCHQEKLIIQRLPSEFAAQLHVPLIPGEAKSAAASMVPSASLVADLDEDAKMQLLVSSANAEFKSVPMAQRRPMAPPPNYVCFICNERGHFKSDCPRKIDVHSRKHGAFAVPSAPRGLPRSMLREATVEEVQTLQTFRAEDGTLLIYKNPDLHVSKDPLQMPRSVG